MLDVGQFLGGEVQDARAGVGHMNGMRYLEDEVLGVGQLNGMRYLDNEVHGREVHDAGAELQDNEVENGLGYYSSGVDREGGARSTIGDTIEVDQGISYAVTENENSDEDALREDEVLGRGRIQIVNADGPMVVHTANSENPESSFS